MAGAFLYQSTINKEKKMAIQEWLDPIVNSLERYQYNNRTYYLGCKVIDMLRISSITNAMWRRRPVPRISPENWRLEKIPEVNRRRTVYLFTYEGIIEIITHNQNAECKRLRAEYFQ